MKNVSHMRRRAATFNPFPEVIAVPSHRREFAQVMVSAPDVHVFILRATDDEGVVMTEGREVRDQSRSVQDAFQSERKEREPSSPEAGLDLAAAVHVTFVLHG